VLIILKFSLIPVMENIIEPTIDFDFSKLYLAAPSSLTGGAYFTRIFLNNKPLYIQTPKCLTKQGFIKSGKKIYTDLMFDNNDTLLIQWLENLETKCQELIYEKGTQWFETTLEKSDIETTFTSPIKIFKSGKFYLLRVNVKPNIKIYNELDEVITLENINQDMHIISILEIQGIKFTSRNFQMEIEVKQSMVVSQDPFLDECFIKKPILRNYPNPKENQSVIANHSNAFSNILNNESKMVLEPIVSNNLKNELKEEPVFTSNFDSLNHLDIKTDDLTEIQFEDLDNNMETISLKKPNEVYYKIYKAAREKAKQAKKEAILAYLEAKNIKKTYMLDDIEDSDSDLENASEISENEEFS